MSIKWSIVQEETLPNGQVRKRQYPFNTGKTYQPNGVREILRRLKQRKAA